MKPLTMPSSTVKETLLLGPRQPALLHRFRLYYILRNTVGDRRVHTAQKYLTFWTLSKYISKLASFHLWQEFLRLDCNFKVKTKRNRLIQAADSQCLFSSGFLARRIHIHSHVCGRERENEWLRATPSKYGWCALTRSHLWE